MKKIIAMLLVMVMIFSVCVFADEVEQSVEAAPTAENVEVATASEEHKDEKEQIYFKAKVVEVSEAGEKEYKMNYMGQEMSVPVIGQDIKLIVQDGKYKGVEINLVYPLGDAEATEYDTNPLKVGSKMYITVSEVKSDDGNTTYDGQIVLPINSSREIMIYVIIAVLLILVIAMARVQSIRTIGVILANTVILFIAFGILYVKAIPVLFTLAITSIAIIVSNIFILNKISKKSIIAILGVIIATILTTILCINMINISDVERAFTMQEIEGSTAKAEYIDIIEATIIIASIGASIAIAIKTVNEHMKGNGIIETMKVVTKKSGKYLNVLFLAIVVSMLTNIFYINYMEYPLTMILLGDDNTFAELLKIVITMVNPIITIPITALFAKFLLEPTKGIDEAK